MWFWTHINWCECFLHKQQDFHEEKSYQESGQGIEIMLDPVPEMFTGTTVQVKKSSIKPRNVQSQHYCCLGLFSFLLDQGPFCRATDCPCFGLCVTLPMGFKARVVLLPAHSLACVQWTQGSHLVLHLPFLLIMVFTVKACVQQAHLLDIPHVSSRGQAMVEANFWQHGALSTCAPSEIGS